MSEAFIRRYYDGINDRRVSVAAALFAPDGTFEPPFTSPAPGRLAYLQFAGAWTDAFPDGRFEITRVEQRNETMCEVYLLATGTHRGALKLGIYQFAPTDEPVQLHVRELFEIRDGHIVVASLTADLNDLTRQLVSVNYGAIASHVERIRRLGEALRDASGDRARQDDLATQLGMALDEARRALRPQFKR